MVITHVRCIPCPGDCFCAATCQCYITQLVHCCTVTGICSCCTDYRWRSIDNCNCLCSCGTMVIARIRCIPCPGDCFCAATCQCYIPQRRYCCLVTGIRCCGCCK